MKLSMPEPSLFLTAYNTAYKWVGSGGQFVRVVIPYNTIRRRTYFGRIEATLPSKRMKTADHLPLLRTISVVLVHIHPFKKSKISQPQLANLSPETPLLEA